MIFPDHTFRCGPQGGDKLMNIIFHGSANHNILYENFDIEYIIPSNNSGSELAVIIPSNSNVERVVTTMKKINAISKRYTTMKPSRFAFFEGLAPSSPPHIIISAIRALGFNAESPSADVKFFVPRRHRHCSDSQEETKKGTNTSPQ